MLVRPPADRFLRRPAIQLLRSSVPVSDDVAHIAHENGVVREIQQAGLLGSLRHFDFELVAGLQKILLDAAPNGGEPGKKQRKQYEDDTVCDVITLNLHTANPLPQKVRLA